MVTSGTHVNSGCCFDYGNGEANRRDNGIVFTLPNLPPDFKASFLLRLSQMETKRLKKKLSNFGKKISDLGCYYH